MRLHLVLEERPLDRPDIAIGRPTRDSVRGSRCRAPGGTGLQGGVDAVVLPGHGPTLPDLQDISSSYLAHRLQRLDQVLSARHALGSEATTAAVTDVVYPDIERSVRFAAEYSVEAQLAYLDSVNDDLTASPRSQPES